MLFDPRWFGNPLSLLRAPRRTAHLLTFPAESPPLQTPERLLLSQDYLMYCRIQEYKNKDNKGDTRNQ